MAHIGQLRIIEIANALFIICTMIFTKSLLSIRFTRRWGWLCSSLLQHHLDCLLVSISELYNLLLLLFSLLGFNRQLFFSRLFPSTVLLRHSHNLIFFSIRRFQWLLVFAARSVCLAACYVLQRFQFRVILQEHGLWIKLNWPTTFTAMSNPISLTTYFACCVPVM